MVSCGRGVGAEEDHAGGGGEETEEDEDAVGATVEGAAHVVDGIGGEGSKGELLHD